MIYNYAFEIIMDFWQQKKSALFIMAFIVELWKLYKIIQVG